MQRYSIFYALLCSNAITNLQNHLQRHVATKDQVKKLALQLHSLITNKKVSIENNAPNQFYTDNVRYAIRDGVDKQKENSKTNVHGWPNKPNEDEYEENQTRRSTTVPHNLNGLNGKNYISSNDLEENRSILLNILVHDPNLYQTGELRRHDKDEIATLDLISLKDSKSIVNQSTQIPSRENVDGNQANFHRIFKDFTFGNHNTLQVYPSFEDCIHFLEMLKRNSNGTLLTKNIRNYVQQLINESENKKLHPLQMKQLQIEFGLSKSQLYNLIQNMRDTPGKVTPDGKQYLRNWLYKNKLKSPSTQERNEMQKKLNWSRRQLNQQIHLIRDELLQKKLQSDNDPQEDKILSNGNDNTKYLRKNDDNYNPNTNEIDTRVDFESGSDLNLNYARTPPIQKWQLQIINEFARTHTGKILTKDIEILQSKTNLTKKQLYNRLRVINERNGVLTSQKKCIIQQWYEAHNNSIPELSEDWAYLQNITNLNKTQLYQQFRRIRNKGGLITDTQRNIVWEWVKVNQGRAPTTEERSTLIEQSKLTPLQLKSMLQRYRRQYNVHNLKI